MKFFSLRNAISQTSEGLMEKFLKTFQSKGISDVIGKKILYFPSDSATINSGLKNGLTTKMWENFGDHISFVWCLAHRLELTIKDAFKGSDMTEIECVFNLLYSRYKNSSKKWREIEELFQSMKDDFDFENSGISPTKTSGMRWISHCLNALHKFYNKFEVWNFKGICQKVVLSSVITNAALFSDILAPVKDLSIALQNNSFNIVDTTTKITECIDINKNMLNSLNTDEKFVFWFSYIQKLICENESETYQNIKITNYACTVDSLTRNAI